MILYLNIISLKDSVPRSVFEILYLDLFPRFCTWICLSDSVPRSGLEILYLDLV